MKKIVLFNHKGGVSKTTSTFYLGWMIANMGTKFYSLMQILNVILQHCFSEKSLITIMRILRHVSKILKMV